MANVYNRIVSIKDRICHKMSQSPMKEACAEFFGTFVLVVLGDGVMASCILGRLYFNSVIVGAFGWGLALMAAVSIAGGVSGGHVNPAVTTGLAIVKKCPVKHMIYYIGAQYIGSFLAAAVVYTIYIDAIEMYDGGLRQIPPATNSTAEIFATYPQDFASPVTCVLDQILSAALFLIVICAATDSKNLGAPLHLQPVIIGLGLTAIILAFGHNCGAPLNPARDLSPRVFTAISGWGTDVFSYHNYKWFWIPVIGPHFGGVIGVWLYKLLIESLYERSTTLQERDNRTTVDHDQNGGRLNVNLPSSSVIIPGETEVLTPVTEKATTDTKLTDCYTDNLLKQNV